EFVHLVEQVRRRLLSVVGSSDGSGHEAILIQGSGTYAVEAMIGTFVPKSGRLLVIDNGAYGARMGEIAHVLGIDAHVLPLPPALPVDPRAVAQAISADHLITHVAAVHCETTTGVLNPIRQIGEVAHDG